RRDLLAVLEQLHPADWDKPTMCQGWRVRDVVSHVAAGPDLKARQVATALVHARGDVERMLDSQACAMGERPIEEILNHYRANVESTSLPPTVGVEQYLVDVVIHSLDICQPNGWDLELPADRARRALNKLVTLGRPFRGKDRSEGLHLDTTDIDWRCGCGDHVRGPSRAMLLGLAGRTAACDQLCGDGVADLASRS
ncbi:MAG: maleylpyruvate isomerase family mycothiol-dependent enzyme, partial [Acidimicrobiales bacterium]